MAAVLVGDDADGGRHKSAAADRLERPEDDQDADIGRKAAQQRRQRERDDTEQEHTPTAEDVAHLTGERVHDDLHELVAGERPADPGQRRIE